MAPDTGPNESVNQNDEYLSNAPPYNFPDTSSDEDDDLEEGGDYMGNDDDSDGGDMAGYQLLNQESAEDSAGDRIGRRENGYTEDEIDSENNSSDPMSSSIFPIADSLLPPPPVDEIAQQLESELRPDIELDEVKIDQIKRAMSGFNLPSTSIPGWASVVTEDQLADFIHCKTKSNQPN